MAFVGVDCSKNTYDVFCHAYRNSVCYQAKTDAIDAAVLARFVEKESDRLRLWAPPDIKCERARQLLGVRQTLVDACVSLEQSFSGVPEAGSKAISQVKRTIRTMRKEALALEEEIAELLKDNASFRRALKVTGFGVCSAAILAYVFSKGTFSSSDKLVAFVGLDVRVRDDTLRLQFGD